MILQALVKHYENLAETGKVAKKGWSDAKVSYTINLTKDGQVKSVFERKKDEQRGKKTIRVPQILKVPEMVTRSSGISANFLCDNSKYLLGIDKDSNQEVKNQRVLECFQAARKKHLEVLDGVEGEAALAIRLFFENWNPECAQDHPEIEEKWEEITDGGNLTFCIGMGNEAQEDFYIKEAWESRMGENTSADDNQGICLVTGKRTKISRIHKTIKGVPGAQSSGAALVSFNAPAFESYGKEQSYNAPVGEYAEFAYTTALNYLLSQRDYSIQIGDTKVVCWSESGEEAYQKGFIWGVDPRLDNQDIAKGLFEGLRKQREIVLEDIVLDPEQKFYILGLAPNAARLSVRFFYQDSFGHVLENLASHYQRLKLIKPTWENREHLGIRDMLDETVNQKSKDKTPIPNMAAMTLQAVIAGNRYPTRLYSDTLIRIRAEQGKVTWGRASIIKAYLIKNCNLQKGDSYMALNEEREDIGYVCGRLFAVLEAIQMDANPGIKATIRDRYFNSVCATPASIFPILIKLKNSHMKKLERDKEGSKIYYEKLLTSIMEKIENYPRRLSLEDQGKFVLGYYHQMQKKYEKREDK